MDIVIFLLGLLFLALFISAILIILLEYVRNNNERKEAIKAGYPADFIPSEITPKQLLRELGSVFKYALMGILIEATLWALNYLFSTFPESTSPMTKIVFIVLAVFFLVSVGYFLFRPKRK